MSWCRNSHTLKRCRKCGHVGCDRDGCTYQGFHADRCNRCGDGWPQHFDSLQEDHKASSGSHGSGSHGEGVLGTGAAILLGLIVLAVKFWWVTLIILILVGVGIAIYFSFKNKNQPTYPSYQQPAYPPFVENVYKPEPPKQELPEFKYKWSIKGEEFIGTRKCKDEQSLRSHVARVGGTLIEILGISGKEKSVANLAADSVNNTHISEDAVVNINNLSGNMNNGPVKKKYSEMELARMLNYPEILPCAFDQNMYAWAERIKRWGTPIIVHHNPVSRDKEKLTLDELLKLMNDPASMSTFDKWHVTKLNYKSVEFVRDYNGMDGKSYHDRVVLDIDLKDSIKEIMKFKF